MDEDLVCFKVDMKDAFNLVSRQSILEECATFYPELLPCGSYCYGSHPLLWHPLGKITSVRMLSAAGWSTGPFSVYFSPIALMR